MSKERGITIAVVGNGNAGTTTPIIKDKVVIIGNNPQPTPYNAPIPLTPINYVLPYFDGKSARNKRREAQRKAKKGGNHEN